eukprot:g2765.t1
MPDSLLGYAGLPEVDNETSQKYSNYLFIAAETIGCPSQKNGVSELYGSGKTLIHEMGHVFGLLHIFDEDECVSDTPPQVESNMDTDIYFDPKTGLKSTTKTAMVLSGNRWDVEGVNNTWASAIMGIDECHHGMCEMFCNYMDYAPDECLWCFTKDQTEKMHATIDLFLTNVVVPATMEELMWFTNRKQLVAHLKMDPKVEGAEYLQYMKNMAFICEQVARKALSKSTLRSMRMMLDDKKTIRGPSSTTQPEYSIVAPRKRSVSEGGGKFQNMLSNLLGYKKSNPASDNSPYGYSPARATARQETEKIDTVIDKAEAILRANTEHLEPKNALEQNILIDLDID